MEAILKMHEFFVQELLPGFKKVMQLQIEHQPCYLASELPEDVRENVVNKHRDQAAEWFDHELIFDDFKERMKDKYAFKVSNVYYSGFWSQGDGACFEGWPEDIAKFIEAIGFTFPTIRMQLLIDENFSLEVMDSLSVGIKHDGGCYYHENSMDVSTDFVNSEMEIPSDDLRAFDEAVQEWCVDQAHELYIRLRDSYEAATSDQGVLEMLDANEYRFWYDGTPA